MIEVSGKTYYTIKEFSELAGVSTQSVYKKVGNQLSTYVATFCNRKMIDSRALSEVYGLQVDNLVVNQFATSCNQKTTNKAADEIGKSQSEQTDISQDLLEMLKEEIKKKDQQIERLQASLDKAYMQISEMAQKAQYITAADKTEKIMQQQKQDDIIDPVVGENQNTENSVTVEEKPKKRRFLFWTF